jgi:hypothetical protein
MSGRDTSVEARRLYHMHWRFASPVRGRTRGTQTLY